MQHRELLSPRASFISAGTRAHAVRHRCLKQEHTLHQELRSFRDKWNSCVTYQRAKAQPSSCSEGFPSPPRRNSYCSSLQDCSLAWGVLVTAFWGWVGNVPVHPCSAWLFSKQYLHLCRELLTPVHYSTHHYISLHLQLYPSDYCWSLSLVSSSEEKVCLFVHASLIRGASRSQDFSR